MGSTNIKSEKSVPSVFRGGEVKTNLPLYSLKQFNKFNPKVLGLGKVDQPSNQIDTIAAIFDLSGFTNFCSKADPHLFVPEYLSDLLNWMFKKIREELISEKLKDKRILRTKLPFFSKFMGDGVLFLWDCSGLDNYAMCIVLVLLSRICQSYKKECFSKANKKFSDVPSNLRCGVARGTVCSIGDGNDFVGPCINLAARLQKLSRLTFCFSRKGLDYEKGMIKKTAELFTVKSVEIRGIGQDEKVCVRTWEFDKLLKKERALFKDE